MTNVIQELIQSSKNAQVAYEQELQKLSNELDNQKNYWETLVKEMETKHNSMIDNYESKISELKSRNQILN